MPTETHVEGTISSLLSAALWSMTALPGSQENFVTTIHWYLVFKFSDHEGSLGNMTVTFS